MRIRLLTLSAAVTSLLVGLFPTAASASELPAPTPARTGAPSSIAVLGDSISTATGTGRLGAEVPNNSWSTGTNATVNSNYRRLLAINPAINGRNFNMASNGRRMVHMASQAAAMPVTTQYVQVQLGGNDLCKETLADMTPVEDYRAQFVAGLEAIAERAPEALVSVQSIPDIYNLWYIRYAPASLNGEESSQASQARAYVTLSLIPCLSLLANPASTSEADMTRRFAVRERNIAFNQVLEEECAKVLRCRFDGHATFNFSSNRVDPPYGELLPRAQWGFTDLDISRNTISGCPLSGALFAGCGDHFHPSIAGLAKLSTTAWESSYQWSDSTAPVVTIDADSDWRNDPVIEVEATDAAGVRGIEIRVDGGPWQATLGGSASVTVDEGTSVVEARALDVNGNLSASQLVEVNVDTTDPTARIDGPADGAAFTLGSTPGAPDYTCDDDRSGVASCTDDGIDTSTVGGKTLTVTAVDNAGNVHTESISYSVHYGYSGLTGSLAGARDHQVGAVLPVRFTLADADGGLRSDAVASAQLVGAGTSSSQPGNGKTTNVARWDAAEQQYVLNLATRGLAAGAYELVVTLDDGTEHRTPITLVAAR